MAKKIVRYLLEGDGTIPKFVQDGGYFPQGNELVGISVDEEKRFVPLTVVRMSKVELLAWVSSLPRVVEGTTAQQELDAFLESKGMSDYVE